MIEVTDEMIELFRLNHDPANPEEQPDIRSGIAAVLHIVERDYAIGPALCDEPHPTEDLAYCELVRGHAERSGRGHSATVTKAVDW